MLVPDGAKEFQNSVVRQRGNEAEKIKGERARVNENKREIVDTGRKAEKISRLFKKHEEGQG